MIFSLSAVQLFTKRASSIVVGNVLMNSFNFFESSTFCASDFLNSSNKRLLICCVSIRLIKVQFKCTRRLSDRYTICAIKCCIVIASFSLDLG